LTNGGRSEGSYILSTGEAGAARLAILGRVLQPTTETFLSRAGLQPGMRTLDLGCGGGDVTGLNAAAVASVMVSRDCQPDGAQHVIYSDVAMSDALRTSPPTTKLKKNGMMT
jgi:hypothetical protein